MGRWNGSIPAIAVDRATSFALGQYLLVIKCAVCAHERRAYPNLLAHFCGWDAKLADLEKRLRCSKCGKKSCQIRVVEMQKPRGTPQIALMIGSPFYGLWPLLLLFSNSVLTVVNNPETHLRLNERMIPLKSTR